jgi:hypothetical protein
MQPIAKNGRITTKNGRSENAIDFRVLTGTFVHFELSRSRPISLNEMGRPVVERWLGDYERGYFLMIQRHGIGVIDTDGWVSPDPHRSIPTPSIVHMAKVINLRAARKRAARLQDEQRAAERRAQYGVPKVEKLLVKARVDKARREVEGHRIENGEGR